MRRWHWSIHNGTLEISIIEDICGLLGLKFFNSVNSFIFSYRRYAQVTFVGKSKLMIINYNHWCVLFILDQTTDLAAGAAHFHCWAPHQNLIQGNGAGTHQVWFAVVNMALPSLQRGRVTWNYKKFVSEFNEF